MTHSGSTEGEQSDSIVGLDTFFKNTERSMFDVWMSDSGRWPRAIERAGDGYVLLASDSAWVAWRAAWAAALKVERELVDGRVSEALDNAAVPGEWILVAHKAIHGI